MTTRVICGIRLSRQEGIQDMSEATWYAANDFEEGYKCIVLGVAENLNMELQYVNTVLWIRKIHVS